MNIRAVLAVTAALLLVLLAGAHLVMNCLPPATKSLFVFNANEDNRLCLETILEPTRCPISTMDMNQRKSMVLISQSQFIYIYYGFCDTKTSNGIRKAGLRSLVEEV